MTYIEELAKAVKSLDRYCLASIINQHFGIVNVIAQRSYDAADEILANLEPFTRLGPPKPTMDAEKVIR